MRLKSRPSFQVELAELFPRWESCYLLREWAVLPYQTDSKTKLLHLEFSTPTLGESI